MNSLALVLKNKSLDFDSLNEFLSSIEEDVIINETIDYYKVVFKDADINLLKEAFESYLFDADSKMKVYLDTFESEEELEDKLDVISKYFNDSLTGFIYDSKTLLDELLNPNLSEFKIMVFKEYASDYEMQNLLKVYIENNMNVLKSSKILYIHRNTLLNKLERFRLATGYDPKDFKDAYLIYSLLK